MKGNIFNIQRFSTNDGPGIRTVVFLKGCPLSCIWCHNPESNSIHADIFYDSKKCINCRRCEEKCKHNQHIFDCDKHLFLRDNCKKCLECVAECPVGALEICGNKVSSTEVVSEILRDKDFYTESDGGITVSGGEPLMQYDFSLDILKKTKEAGIHTAIETCGYCYRELDEISKYVDLWLFDIKLFSESEHIKYTGVSNEIILKNLYYLDSIGKEIILRCPIIPEVNLTNEHFDEIVNVSNRLKNVVAIHFQPYHPLGVDKADKLGQTPKYDNRSFLQIDSIQPFVSRIKDKTTASIEIL